MPAGMAELASVCKLRCYRASVSSRMSHSCAMQRLADRSRGISAAGIGSLGKTWIHGALYVAP
jgi:hypothetical protein